MEYGKSAGQLENDSKPDYKEKNVEGEKVEKFAVIATETNRNDEVISIDIVIADGGTKEKIASKYYIITPEYRVREMFSSELRSSEKEARVTDRKQVLGELKQCEAYEPGKGLKQDVRRKRQLDHARTGMG